MLVYLIPSVRNSDNKPGMYDLVTNTFFTNEGEGEFEWEELESQEDFIIDGTPLHTYKLQSLLREISEDPQDNEVREHDEFIEWLKEEIDKNK